MGTTARTMEFIRPHYDACRRIMFICQRKTMVRSIEARTLDRAVDENDEAAASADDIQCELAKYGMNFECYDNEDFRGVISSAEHPFLICEYESLHRLEGTFDYIILDEFRSTAATMVASTNGERIAHHWEILKALGKVAQKVLFLDADMCADSCSYKVQDMLMKYRTEFRVHALLYQFRCSENKTLQSWDQHTLNRLQQFLLRSKQQHACNCCGSEHAASGTCRIENTVHKMKKTLRLANDGKMLLQLSKDAAAGKRIAMWQCARRRVAASFRRSLCYGQSRPVHWQD
jgi:hypothetical protein